MHYLKRNRRRNGNQAFDGYEWVDAYHYMYLQSSAAVIKGSQLGFNLTTLKCYLGSQILNSVKNICMQLGEGLILLAVLRKRRTILEGRIKRCFIVQQYDEISEDPVKLIRRFGFLNEEISRLEAAIYHTSFINTIETDQGRITLAEAIMQREHLKEVVDFLRTIGEEAVPGKSHSPMRSELLVIPRVSVAKLQSNADDVTRSLQRLKLRIETLSWALSLDDYVPNEIAE